MARPGTDIYPGGFMNIVIVGCGKVGMVITQQLSSEYHNITLVDEDSEAIAAVTNHYDAMGVVGNGKIAKRFIKESKYVSGVDVSCVYGRNIQHLEEFCKSLELNKYYTDYDEFLKNVDVVYVALPHSLHFAFYPFFIE